MKKLPFEYKLLSRIQDILNKYLDSIDTSVEIRSTELYSIVKRDIELNNSFSTSKEFNQFLRKHHQIGVMRTFINYRVDDSNKNYYQWFFRAKTKTANQISRNTDVNQGTYNFYQSTKSTIAPDGTKLNSSQELFIYERLIKESHLRIDIEYPLTKNGKTKYVDFTILNKLNQQRFYWEHFGMTNNEKYKSRMADKIDWYKKNGFETVENGGNLIYTYFSTENNLIKDVSRYIQLITKTTYNIV